MNEFIKSIKWFWIIKIINNNYYLSSILRYDRNIIKLIKKWILETVNKNEIKFELLFKMSENGTNSIDFHKYCDNKGPSLTLVKTTKNKIFGGFTPLSWNTEGKHIEDINNQTFIFSLNLKKKFNMIKKNEVGIYCSKDYGPRFGAGDFGLRENMKNGETYANECCNFLSNNNLELTGGKGDNENFNTEELEVYKVIY